MLKIKIKRIIPVKKSMAVYDIIGVPNNHNFVANNLVVHNCDEAVNFCCLDAKTNIITRNGVEKIKDLVNRKDFEVLSYSTKKVFKRAEKCIYTKRDVVYELVTEDGKKIRCTKEHLFLTKNGYKKLSDLNKGDFVATV